MRGCAVPAGEPELRHDASLRSDEAANLIEIGPLVVGYGEGGKRDRMSEADNRSAGTPTLAAILNVLFKKADMPWPLCSFGPAIRIIPFCVSNTPGPIPSSPSTSLQISWERWAKGA
jgi:hypothetical protein